MDYSYILTLIMFCGGLFGGGNDLLDYVPADAYWKLKSAPVTFDGMAAEVEAANPAAAGNLAKVFETATGDDRDRLALALIDQGEAARPALDKLARSTDADLAARAKACLDAIGHADQSKPVRRLMAIRTLGAIGRKEGIPLLEPLLKSKQPFVASYAAEEIATLQGKPAVARPISAALKDDIWRVPADCRAVAHLAASVVKPGLADRVLAGMKQHEGIDRQDAIDRMTFTLVTIAERFGNIRFEGITLAASDLGENAGYVVAILRGYYDHSAVNHALADDHTPYNDTPAGRVYVPGGMAILAQSDNLLIFAASPAGTPPVQAVLTVASPAQPIASGVERPVAAPNSAVQLKSSPEMVKLIASLDAVQPLWAAYRSTDAYRKFSGLASLQTAAIAARQTPSGSITFHLDAKLADSAAATQLASAIKALLPINKPAAETRPAGGADRSPSLPDALALLPATSLKKLQVADDQITGDGTITLTRSDIMLFLLNALDKPAK